MIQLQEDISELQVRVRELNLLQEQIRSAINQDEYTKIKLLGLIQDEIKGTIETIQDKEGRL